MVKPNIITIIRDRISKNYECHEYLTYYKRIYKNLHLHHILKSRIGGGKICDFLIVPLNPYLHKELHAGKSVIDDMTLYDTSIRLFQLFCIRHDIKSDTRKYKPSDDDFVKNLEITFELIIDYYKKQKESYEY